MNGSPKSVEGGGCEGERVVERRQWGGQLGHGEPEREERVGGRGWGCGKLGQLHPVSVLVDVEQRTGRV